MGIGVLIIGESGAGKSTSLRNFAKGEIGILNVAGKPLPFKNDLDKLDNARYNQIHQALMKNGLNAYVIDDAGYLLSFDNFKRAKENGYGKFVDMAQSFEQMLEAVAATDENTIVYIMMHPEYDATTGRMKPKLIGKMLDEKLCVEGLFSIVLVAKNAEGRYVFVTQSDGTTPAKTPMGMFKDAEIDNDLKMVDATIRAFYNLEPLGGGKQ